MGKFCLIWIFLMSFGYCADLFEQDCKEVGDYIHKNAHRVHHSLYVLYNGTNEKKISTFEKFYRAKAYNSHFPVGWGVKARAKYFDTNFKDSFKYLKENSDKELKFVKTNLKERSFKKFQKEERAFNLFFSRYYCKRVIGQNIRSCRKGMRKLFRFAQVQRLRKGEKGSVTSLTLPQTLQKVIVSSSHLKVTHKAVSSLLPGAVSQEYQSTTNFFDLLSDKAEELNLSKKQKDDLVWDTIGAYATRGASFEGYGDHLFSPQNKYHFSLMYELFNLVHVYDANRKASDGQFSLPKMGRNTCQFGKSYHFWMSAYLSRYLLKNGFSKEEAFQASFAMGVLYDFMGSGAPQRERVKVLQEGMDSIYVKSIFQSVLFKSLGALYGVDPQKVSQTDANKLYQKMRSDAKDVEGKIYMKEIYHMKNLDGFIQKLGLKSLIKSLASNK